MSQVRLYHAFDPVLFAREVLGFVAEPLQERVLDPGIRRGILNCRRQWGKSTLTAIKAVHRVWFDRGSLVSPSARQSGEFVKKCAALLRVLDVPVRGDGTNRMSLMLPSGSRIVGLPANEGTTRGFTAPAMVMID